MSKTKHLNRSYFRNINERCAFLEEYHKDQGIDAPFEIPEPCKLRGSGLCSMQKGLSEWMDVEKIQIDNNIMREISKPNQK